MGSRPVERALERLVATLREEGGLLAGVIAAADGRASRLGRLAAEGPRAAAHPDDVELVVEAIHEGYLLHYGEPRIVSTDDADLALLAGDRLYALGLAHLATLGDVDAIAQLADVIALCAQAHAAGDANLAAAVWEAGAVAVGWGSSPALEDAKAAARAGHPEAAQALRTAAAQRASGASTSRLPDGRV